MRVLLAEDDATLGDGLLTGLLQRGFQADWVRDGATAERELKTGVYAAAILDLGLPLKDGIEVLKSIRERKINTPVLVLTARDAIPDRVLGLDLGADDYVIKPVDLIELAARLRALIRRSQGRLHNVIQSGRIELDPSQRIVWLDGRVALLANREFDLLHALMCHPGRVLTREQLEIQLYRWGSEVDSNSIEVHVHHLRRRLYPEVIKTVRGVGYTVLRPPERS
jgi:two-component system OmpR family response regulator/two-component system response regulator QseB